MSEVNVTYGQHTRYIYKNGLRKIIVPNLVSFLQRIPLYLTLNSVKLYIRTSKPFALHIETFLKTRQFNHTTMFHAKCIRILFFDKNKRTHICIGYATQTNYTIEMAKQ